MNHCMLDIETLDVTRSAVVLSIGAVVFGGPNYECFYANIELKDYKNFPKRTMSPGTVLWWMQQSEQARMVFTDQTLMLTVRGALTKFADVYTRNQCQSVWANGSDFDMPILASLYEDAGIAVPWKYNALRDYRTLRQLYPEITLEREGVSHNALDDALYQTRHLQLILKSMGRNSA